MSFGSRYQPTEYNMYVPEGDYKVRLGIPKDMERSGYRIREIPIEISGHRGYGPTHWSIFDAPNDPEKLDAWNKARTRDCDAFGVDRGDFRPESWRGKVGWVHIGKDTKGYTQVKWSILPPNGPMTAKPAQSMQQGRDYPPPEAVQTGFAPVPGDGFKDDIPF